MDYFETGNFKLSKQLGRIIDQEVKLKLKKKYKEYTRIVEEHADLSNQIAVWKNAYRKEAARNQQVEADGIEKGKWQLTNGFKVGDPVYNLYFNIRRAGCSKCLEKGELVVQFNGNTEIVRCPNCQGAGTVREDFFSIETGKISEISIYIGRSGVPNFEVYINPDRSNESYKLGSDKIFKTLSEAEEALKKRKGKEA